MRKRKKNNERKSSTNSSDRWAERIIYAIIFIITLLAMITLFNLSKEFGGYEEKDGHFKKIEKEN